MRIRKIASCEQMYIDVQETTNSYTIQNILEISGSISIAKLNFYLNETIKNCIGSNVFKDKKFWSMSTNDVKFVQKTFDTYNNYLKNNFFNATIDYNTHSIEAYYIKFNDKNIKLLVFKFFHGVIDGKGTIMFIENFLKILNNISPLQCNNNLNAKDYISKEQFYKKKEKISLEYSLMAINKIQNYKLDWEIINLNKYVPNILIKVARVLV